MTDKLSEEKLYQDVEGDQRVLECTRTPASPFV